MALQVRHARHVAAAVAPPRRSRLPGRPSRGPDSRRRRTALGRGGGSGRVGHGRLGNTAAGSMAEYRDAEEVPVVWVSTKAAERREWFDLGIQISVEGQPVSFAAVFS